MKVSIVGSWNTRRPDWVFRGSFDEFSQACKLIGRELARQGQEIIVGGAGTHTADTHVVSGMLEIISGSKPQQPPIHVIYPEKGKLEFEDIAKRNPNLFSFYPARETRWAEAQLVAIRECNAVITIAGARGTYQAGLTAIVARKKIAPIASFGGASSKVLEVLEDADKKSQNDVRNLRSPWSEFVLERCFRLLGIGISPKILIIHGHSDEWLKVKDWLARQIGIENIEVMVQEYGKGETLPEKFERLAVCVDAAVAIVTPDDRGGIFAAQPDAYLPRARQNVWLEIGWFWGRLGRDKVFVAQKGDVEVPSDLRGIEFYEYKSNVSEIFEKMSKFLEHVRTA